MEAVISVLNLFLHPLQPPGNQVSNPFPANLHWTRPLRSTSGQRTSHFKAKDGLIPPLREGIFSVVGTKNPRYNTMGGIDSRLGRQLTVYVHEYLAPSLVRPTPIPILHCLNATVQVGTSRQNSIADLAWIAILLLLCPGQYFQGSTDTVSTPFHLQDIQFYVDVSPFPFTTATPYNCATASFFSLVFTTHNDGVKGKSIGHGKIDHPWACAVAEVRRLAAHI